MFATEEDCNDYLARLRWPASYRCPDCGNTEWWLTARRYSCCTKCRRQEALKSGTMFQGSRFPMKTWFEVAWHICEQKHGISGLGLKRGMGFGSYHTAREWLQRMRLVMSDPGRTLLNGEVEVDETFIGGVRPGKRGRGAAGKTLVFMAAEIRGIAIGRIRLQVIPDATASTLLDTVDSLVDKGSNVVTDGLSSYAGITARGYDHTVSRHTPHLGKNLLPHVHRVAALLKRWLLGTHQGAVRADHLQTYLDEFVFRFNRRTSVSRGLLFRRLLERMVAHPPVAKRQLASIHRP